NNRSFAEVVQKDNIVQGKADPRRRDNHSVKETDLIRFNVEQEELIKLSKLYVGEVEHPGSTYNVQDALHAEGYFGIKVTPLGANLALLEEQS
ncbi:hypothetical protein A2U01_0079057, partial [Trifolium medium]|nr:hypothetical protein [Trifolium medium]